MAGSGDLPNLDARGRNSVDGWSSTIAGYARADAPAPIRHEMTISSSTSARAPFAMPSGLTWWRRAWDILSRAFGARPAEPLRGTHYFGRAWPINFWNSIRLADLDADFAAIRRDGFNTIVLVVPWGEFQPGLAPVRYHEPAWDRLDRIMRKARAQRLQVVLRIGYAWSLLPDQQLPNVARFDAYMMDDVVRDAFLQFAARIGQAMQRHGNFRFAFASWEDFDLPAAFRRGTERYAGTALDAEYRRFLTTHYTLDTLREIFADPALADVGHTPYPVVQAEYAGDARMRLFNHFWDHLLIERLFKPVQRVLPMLSLEVRVDSEPLPLPDGSVAWVHHKPSYALPGAPALTAYYSISWAMPNAFDTTDAARGLRHLGMLIDDLAEHHPREGIFFDQFLFKDNTIGHEHSTKLALDQITPFITEAAGPLSATKGYALWPLRDYLHSLLYNASFLDGLGGWKASGAAQLRPERSGDHTLVLSAGGRIAQYFDGPRESTKSTLPATFCLEVRTVSGDFKGAVTYAEERIALDITAPGRHVMTLDIRSDLDLGIEVARGHIEIETVYLGRHAVQQGVYHIDGTPGPNLAAVRELNARLARAAADRAAGGTQRYNIPSARGNQSDKPGQ